MKHFKVKRHKPGRLRAGLAVAAAFILCAMPTAASAATIQQQNNEQNTYADAAKEFHVPQELLQAVAYYQSRFENHGGQVSVDGGYGPMNLRTAMQVEDQRGDPKRPIVNKTITPQGDMTLDKAAQLLNVSPDVLKKDSRQNIRGGAAVLAEKAKQLNGGAMPTSLDDWYAVAGRYLGGDNQQSIQSLVDSVYNTLKNGVSTTTTDGQRLSIPAMPKTAAPDAAKVQNKLQHLGLKDFKFQQSNNNGAECPRQVSCRFIPAGYGANSPDPTDYGNYDHANRPKDMKVNYIVIHDTEGSYTSAIQHFQDLKSYVSAHYVIRSSDGEITQMVPTSNVAWHAGDWYMNMHSIGIEHEGYAASGASWYTEAMYQSSANLVKYLANKYNIPLDRDHILGHDNIPTPSDARMPGQHWDPGPYWDWNHYMSLLTGQQNNDVQSSTRPKNIVTIKPNMATNVQTVNNCVDIADPTTCSDQSAPSNFVYVRTAPRSDAPLVTDPLLHPDGAPGSTRIFDWSAKATSGQQFGLAGQQGDWTAIWFANQKGWIYNPASQPSAVLGRGHTITLKPGLSSAHVYGTAYPEARVYPADVSGPAQSQLSYLFSAGQTYVSDGTPPTDYFYDATIDYSLPHDHEIFKGNDKYIKIWYNHRVMFVKADDVVVQ